jgi:glycolate oxidase FAD binding subunit
LNGHAPGQAGATLDAIVEQVRAAHADRRPLAIVGGGTRGRFTRPVAGDALQVAAHAGIVSYEPSELVITARAGTLLAEVEETLAARRQMLGFEPPRTGAASTIGGVVASGLSGPARPYRGSVRDFVLGVELVNGRGEALRFGGQVMKNVAGYDVARLATGACGALGVITEVSLRVLPRPPREATLRWPLARGDALARMLELSCRPWPITALSWDGELLRLRVTGSAVAVEDAVARLEPSEVVEDDASWAELRDYTEPRLAARAGETLWRVAVPPAAADAPGTEPVLLDWGGGLRWLRGVNDAAALREHVATCGGHVTAYDTACGVVPAVPPAPLRALMQRVKRAFDPHAIFDAGGTGEGG